jgi:ubiquinone/menaquinone biosynthesis C-methylase UbiE
VTNGQSSEVPAQPAKEVLEGQAIYNRSVLRIYDLWVLNFSCRLIWRCPKSLMLANYDRNVGRRHLDIGVGTGYFLNRCRFPDGETELTLLDLNPVVLAANAAPLARYRPVQVHADALAPLPLPSGAYDSVGLNFLLHCLPGPWERKSAVFVNAARVLKPGGRVFGSTILASGVPVSGPARKLMEVYNSKGVFHNADDDLAGLQAALDEHFVDVQVTVRGCVALFEASARSDEGNGR